MTNNNIFVDLKIEKNEINCKRKNLFVFQFHRLFLEMKSTKNSWVGAWDVEYNEKNMVYSLVPISFALQVHGCT